MPSIAKIPANYSAVVCGSSCSCVTSISPSFLEGSSSLIQLDISALGENVVSIEKKFLFGCSGLMTLDLGSFKRLSTIGNAFLQQCTKLTTLSFGSPACVVTIGDNFLYDCSSLTGLDLRTFNIGSIGNSFLCNCSDLTNLALGQLTGVTSIGGSFLHGCTGLTTLDLSPLSGVTSIGNSFLQRCSGLTSLDLGPLKGVTKIGNNFLKACSGMTTLDLSELGDVTSVGDSFLIKLGDLECTVATQSMVNNCLNGRKDIRVVEQSRPVSEEMRDSTSLPSVNVGVNSRGGFMTSTSEVNVGGGSHTDNTIEITLAHFRLLQQLGEGAQGVVWKVMDPATRCVMAVKALKSTTRAQRGTLEEEFNLLKHNEHPNLVKVFDFQHSPTPHYTMEYMSAGPITNMITYRQHWETQHEIILQSLRGLQHLHSRSIRHRDLKPHNILYRWNEDGSLCVKISDFGHSKQDLTNPGMSEQRSENHYGTACYSPPESKQVNPQYFRRSDVYSWACSIAHVATGLFPTQYMSQPDPPTLPYSREDLLNVQSGKNVGEGLPEDVADILLQCMSYRKDDRSHVAELLTLFENM